MRNAWYLVKSVPDIYRNEPINIGVIVALGGEVATRFVGQDQHGNVDGRRLPHHVPSASEYRGWIGYFERAAREPDFEERIDRLAKRPRGIVVERRGGFVGGLDEGTIQERADMLFSMAVAHPARVDTPTIEAATDNILSRLSARILRDVPVRVQDRGRPTDVYFRYLHEGSHRTLMDRIHMSGPERQIMRQVNDLLFRIELVERSKKHEEFLVMYDAVTTEASEEQLQRIESYANTVNVLEAGAAGTVAQQLGVSLLPPGQIHYA